MTHCPSCGFAVPSHDAGCSRVLDELTAEAQRLGLYDAPFPHAASCACWHCAEQLRSAQVESDWYESLDEDVVKVKP
jgi:hypothetical protein